MTSYIGSGPYCYANALAMMLAPDGPSPSTIEVPTGSPFGFQLLFGRLPLFDPYGWDPLQGLDQAITLLGRTCDHAVGGTPDVALARLRDALSSGPVLAGPVDMGLLLQQPGATNATGADHYVVIIAADEHAVRFHDPHGHPYASLPTAAFMASWAATQTGYATGPFEMRWNVRRERDVTIPDALRDALPLQRDWLSAESARDVPPGTLANADVL